MIHEDAGSLDQHNVTQKELKLGQQNGKHDYTCGYGHHLTEEECKTWNVNKKFSQLEATNLFNDDLNAMCSILNKRIKTLPCYNKVQISNNCFNSILSILWNVGPGKMFGNATREPSEFWRRMNGIRVNQNGKHIKEDFEYALAKINSLFNGRSD